MDNDEHLKTSLQEIHLRYLNRNMDTNTLRFWVASIISEEKTPDDFKNTIVRMEEYKNYLYKKFREMFIERLDRDITPADFEEFKRFNGNLPIDAITVHRYISGLMIFHDMYVKTLKLAFVNAKKDCNETIIKFYLDRISHSNVFDLPTIVSWIQNDDHMIVQEDVEAPNIKVDHVTTKQLITVENETIDAVQMGLFEFVFNRPMYVQEYFKYIHNRQRGKDIDWYEVHQIHVRNFVKVSEIYNLYTTQKLDEYYYIRTYLYEVDSERFLTRIIDTIIESHEYERNMKETIFSKYHEMFSETLDESDLMYIFSKVQAIKLNVYENDIVDILHEFKKETNVIVSHMFKIFTKVLERHPDVHEIETNLLIYRTQYEKGYTTLDEDLENFLMRSLEFHDIIKKTIKLVFEKEKNCEILPSIMFSMLDLTIQNIQGNGMNNLEQIIRAAIV